MKIYQYTNIEALAYILKSRAIRFNRLDRVDDVEEGNAESLGVKFSKYVFVSCWTEVREESIPLWKMYGGDKGGIRIGMEQKMFKEYLISGADLNRVGLGDWRGAIVSKIPVEDMVNPNFFLFPILNYDNDLFYRQVKYVDDPSALTSDAIEIYDVKDNVGNMKIDMKSFGTYKHRRWEFQNESRFVLYALPYNPVLEGLNPDISSIALQSYLNNKPLPFDDYYLHLRDDAFDGLEITLAPSATDAQRIIIESMVEKYAPNAHIQESSLGQLIRLK